MQCTAKRTLRLDDDDELRRAVRDVRTDKQGRSKPFVLVVTPVLRSDADDYAPARRTGVLPAGMHDGRDLAAESSRIVGTSHRSLGYWRNRASVSAIETEVDAASDRLSGIDADVYRAAQRAGTWPRLRAEWADLVVRLKSFTLAPKCECAFGASASRVRKWPLEKILLVL